MKRFVIEVEVPEPVDGLCSDGCPLMCFQVFADCRLAIKEGVFLKPGPTCPRHPDYVPPVSETQRRADCFDQLVEALEIAKRVLGYYADTSVTTKVDWYSDIEAALKAAKGGKG